MPHSRDPFAYPSEYMELLTLIREVRPQELILMPECSLREARNFRLRFGAFIYACNHTPTAIDGIRPQYAFDAAMFTSKYQLRVQECSPTTALVLIQQRSSLPDAKAVAVAVQKLRESLGTQPQATVTKEPLTTHTPKSSVQSQPTDYDKLIAEMYGTQASSPISQPDEAQAPSAQPSSQPEEKQQ